MAGAGFTDTLRRSMVGVWGDTATNGATTVTGLFSLGAVDLEDRVDDQQATFEAASADVSSWAIDDAITITSSREGKTAAPYAIREISRGHGFTVFMLEDTS